MAKRKYRGVKKKADLFFMDEEKSTNIPMETMKNDDDEEVVLHTQEEQEPNLTEPDSTL